MLTQRFTNANQSESLRYSMTGLPAYGSEPARVRVQLDTGMAGVEGAEKVLKLLRKNGLQPDGGGGMLLDGKYSFAMVLRDTADITDFTHALADLAKKTDMQAMPGTVNALLHDIAEAGAEVLPASCRRDPVSLQFVENGSGGQSLVFSTLGQNVHSEQRTKNIAFDLEKNNIGKFEGAWMDDKYALNVRIDNRVQLAGFLNAFEEICASGHLRPDGGFAAVRKQVVEAGRRLPAYTMPAQAPQR